MMELCRICLSENTGKDVFSLPNDLQVEKTVQEVLMFCLNIELCEDSKFGTLLCEYCYFTIISFYKFKVLALQSDEHLKSIRQCKTKDKKDDKLNCGSGPRECEIKEEIEVKEEIVKYENVEASFEAFDETISYEYAVIEEPAVHQDNTDSQKKKRVCPKKVEKVQKETKKKKEETTCNLCNKKVKNLRQHMQRMHDDRTFTCNLCPKTFSKAFLLHKHAKSHRNHHPYECDICGHKYKQKNYLEIHMISKHSNGKKSFCRTCARYFTSDDKLQEHLLKYYNECTKYKCEICQKGIRSPKALRDHMDMHKGVKRFQCPICDKTFSFYNSYFAHKIAHSNERQYPCRICGATYKRTSERNRHEISAHGKQITKQNEHEFLEKSQMA